MAKQLYLQLITTKTRKKQNVKKVRKWVMTGSAWVKRYVMYAKTLML